MTLIDKETPWLRHSVTDEDGPCQIIFSSHGVAEGGFELESQTRGKPGPKLYINSPELDYYTGGLPALSLSQLDLAEALRVWIDGRAVVTAGCGEGAFAAVLYGAQLQAQDILAINPMISLEDPLSPAVKAGHLVGIPELDRDLAPLIEQSPQSRFQLICAEWDVYNLRHIARVASLTHVRALSLTGVARNAAATLRETGGFDLIYDAILMGTAAQPKIAQMGELLDHPARIEQLHRAKQAGANGDWQTAAPILQAILDEAPETEAALEQFAISQVSTSDKEGALTTFMTAHALNPGRALYRDKLAPLARSLQITDETILRAAGLIATDIEGNAPVDYRSQADDALANGNGDAAALLYKQALMERPGDRSAALGQVKALLQTGQTFRAGRIMRRLLKSAPDDAVLLHNMGVILLKSGAVKRAIPHLSRALEQAPDNAGYAQQLASALYQKKQYPEALQASEKATELNAENAGYQFTKLQIGLATGAIDVAVEAGAALVALEPNIATYRAAYGDALSRQGRDMDAALQNYRMAVTLDMGSQDYKRKLSDLLRQKGRHSEADALMRR
ncbi:MAG: tetratricopeptide repeat protein [Pseudomonadota bacterium]